MPEHHNTPEHIDTEVAVIGGGVQGAGIAQAAVAAGYKAAIFERQHWAAGTSRRSSKLIHGGLRYLETGQIPLVYHSLQERAHLLRNAPDLVRPVKFHIPIYRHTRRRAWQIRAGLMLYFLLSGGGKLARFRKLKRSEWSTLDGLDTQNLQAVFQYWDGQTDDRKLTEAVIESAQDMGANTYCPANFLRAEKNALGYLLHLEMNGRSVTCQCRCLINATGPWVNDIAKRIDSGSVAREVDLVKGSHILVNGRLTQGVYYLESPIDQRAVFAMPWGEQTLVGTTEILHEQGADSVEASPEEIHYLQETLRHYFPNADTEVLDAWAGLRVLPRSDESANERDRDTVLHCEPASRPSMVAVYGGKLTSYRHTADRVIKAIKPTLGARPKIADTRFVALAPSSETGA
ncbi:FAD-dependent oxidoreductase [Spongiibacter nanhainus]|uniref:FAD-dependent oxidoreductase n=1 Tax=Spongiibacter nanhainus TaxID=2794344 RepID=A0A7T4UQC2_9GAMM|nr:FAD-dependent oxidoreductase [Spongiibacter nanhainus]QQD18531.1 FAD-dependent oxidoreductase [Spongiibacter nanhainus]